MAPFPDEVDVFTGPHWRMKQLVGLYCEKLSQTNFSNNSDFRSFLQSLCVTFKEFKMHEQIENDYIISLLRQRCCTAYDVHSDNKLSEMLTLFEKGLHSVKSEYEQLNYVQQLKERLEAFTQDFLPHMKEEEEVFQPMLMEYFSYEELKDIKKRVMAQHCSQQQGSCAPEMLKGFSLWRHVELQRAFKYTDHVKTGYEVEDKDRLSTHISQLPAEILLRFFRFLGPRDLCRCSQVCSSWSELSRTGSLWRHLYPVHWARGDYYSGPPGELDQEPDDDWVKSRVNEGLAFQEWDEDADVDESDASSQCVSSAVIGPAQREKRLLNGLIQHLLPSVGPSVKSMVLAYSSTVSSKMVRQILSFCPNLTHLDLTQTDVTDSAFDSWSLGPGLSLDHLDLSGCEKITDLTLKKLSVGLGDRRARLSKSSTVPIKPVDEKDVPGPAVRQRQAFIFKQGSGQWGSTRAPTQVWVLDSSDLTDIEDAAWGRQGSGADGLVEMQLVDCCCVCRRNSRGRWSSNSYLQQRQQQLTTAARPAEMFCGHSTCCSADVAFRTLMRPQTDSRGNPLIQIWTKCSSPSSSSSSSSRSEPGKKTDQSHARRSLRFLSLSGCYQVTDSGLRALSQRGGLPVLEHLNLSGCLFITEVGLQELVSVCPSLNHEHFYYCDNINGPHADTASGCQNLQCGFRACCRSGE